jgi:uncharacterized glyoxalase superfamily protein PhnB
VSTPSAARPPVLPQLRYERPAEAIDWLVRVFGFVEQSRMSGPDGTVYIADLRTPGGGALLVSGSMGQAERVKLETAFPEFYQSGERAWPNLLYSITVVVPDVDAHLQHARDEGAQLLTGVADQPWGLRDYEAVDLEGRCWNFSQHIRATTPEEWGATSTNP